MKNLLKLFTILIISLQVSFVKGQMTEMQIDALVSEVIKKFEVPGIAVGIVKDGKIIHAKGYGVRSLDNKKPVTESTIFGIASHSKAFTAAAVAMLIEEKKLTWDTKVKSILPDFKLYDDCVTEEFTVKDLLCHRSGHGLGAGDLMFWPDANDFTKDHIIKHYQYLKPEGKFRNKYEYNNILYIVAGMVIEKVSGLTWEKFIQTRFFDPLEIKSSAPSFKLLKDKSNVIDPHAPVEGKVKVIRRDWSENANAAGGINANILDMSKWLITLMNKGKYGPNNEKVLLSENSISDMWNLQTPISVRNGGVYNTHFNGYGIGWFVSDVKGYKQVTHTGGLAGIVTQTTLLPELNLGIMVYTNQQSGQAFNAITNTIKDSYQSRRTR